MSEYIAVIAVGGYKEGDIVPKEKAEMWNSMYKYPHAKKVETGHVTTAPVQQTVVEQPQKGKKK